MNKHLSAVVAVTACLFSVSASAEPGEYWEMTIKVEGGPSAMPATTMKICLPKGVVDDMSNFVDIIGEAVGDEYCEAKDVKKVGNKTTWKVRCNNDGDVMTSESELTTTANGFQGKTQVNSKDMNVTWVSSGKKLGGSCDTEEQEEIDKKIGEKIGKEIDKKIEEEINKKIEEEKKIIGQMCDTSQRRNTSEWIYASGMILPPDAACADQRGQLCERVRKDAPKDAETYTSLLLYEQLYEQQEEQEENVSVVKSCKLDMAATTKSICKTLNGENYSLLAAHCPSEAKKYREVQRRKECEGRSYTAETRAADLKKCLSGKNEKWEPEDGGQDETPAPRKSGKTPTSDMLDGAKKLKGLFGF